MVWCAEARQSDKEILGVYVTMNHAGKVWIDLPDANGLLVGRFVCTPDELKKMGTDLIGISKSVGDWFAMVEK